MGVFDTQLAWTAPVDREINRILALWPHLEPRSYVDHPWPGWDAFSVDWWEDRDTFRALSIEDGQELHRHIWHRSAILPVRHTIFRHRLTTSWGGDSLWRADDHSGRLRHYHVTYWPH